MGVRTVGIHVIMFVDIGHHLIHDKVGEVFALSALIACLCDLAEVGGQLFITPGSAVLDADDDTLLSAVRHHVDNTFCDAPTARSGGFSVKEILPVSHIDDRIFVVGGRVIILGRPDQHILFAILIIERDAVVLRLHRFRAGVGSAGGEIPRFDIVVIGELNGLGAVGIDGHAVECCGIGIAGELRRVVGGVLLFQLYIKRFSAVGILERSGHFLAARLINRSEQRHVIVRFPACGE